MDKELPKIDLPEDWLAGTDINKELLGLYTNFPVRLKCEVFVLCIEGTVEATLNLNKIQVYPHSLVTLPPGSIFQVNSSSDSPRNTSKRTSIPTFCLIPCTIPWENPSVR